MRKKQRCTLGRFAGVCMALLLCLSVTAVADPLDEQTYTYNSYAQSVPVPDLFVADSFIVTNNMECEGLDSPNEMCLDGDGNLYICDKNNNRIVVLDKDLNFVKTMEEFYNPELDETVYLFEPSGIYVDDGGQMYIANTLDASILCCDSEGNINRMYYTPEVHQFNDDVPFEPTRLLADAQGNLYVLCRNIYQGIVMFNADGEFENFYGAETVYASAEVRSASAVWRGGSFPPGSGCAPTWRGNCPLCRNWSRSGCSSTATIRRAVTSISPW